MTVAEMSKANSSPGKLNRVGRPRGYDLGAVVERAGDLFWERGYEMTSIDDLEKKTGLDRSSLYHAFGNKHALFEAALRCYVEDNIDARLRGMRQADASLATVVSFFTGMAQAFRRDPRTARGCLMVNTIAELGSRDPSTVAAGAAYRDEFRAAFAAALSQAAARAEVDAKRTRSRAELLAAMTMGLFITARIDLADAAHVCESVAAEVASWRNSAPVLAMPPSRAGAGTNPSGRPISPSRRKRPNMRKTQRRSR
jgi:TetR/AcrR family transcriptional regulator, transcriptional repressor for nem operon